MHSVIATGFKYLVILSLVVVIFIVFHLRRLQSYKRKLRVRSAKSDLKSRQLDQIGIERRQVHQTNERLTKELRHRILRNLETISTLLNNQSASLDDNDARQVIEKTESRIKAMFFIHRGIFEVDGEEYVEISSFVKQIVPYLDSYISGSGNVEFVFDLQLLKLNLSKAEPLGLLINEVLSNCLKHAFVNQDAGLIQISLRRESGNNVRISIEDRGGTKGLVLDENEKTMGLSLIRGLADQLGATLSFHHGQGLRVTLIFEAD